MIDAVIFTRYFQDTDGRWRPVALKDIYAWARANNETLPGGTSYGKYEDLTGQSQPALRAIKVFAARLIVSNATATQFADDSRIFILGYQRLSDDIELAGQVLFSNWNTTLTQDEIDRLVSYLLNHGYTMQQITAHFSASDTRLEIARKLKELFLK